MNQYISEICPSKLVYLGGTGSESNWRDMFIPLLAVSYFDPTVHERIDPRNDCSCILHCITPKMVGYYAIAELISDAIHVPHKTVLLLLKTDSGYKFTESEWVSLLQVSSLVSRCTANVFTDMTQAANYLNTK